eukprot:Rhum_TRINITY_DN3684_c0_g1::Rhum_TRINITY_DN3684_c0_g1_i1::g.11566::m.11566
MVARRVALAAVGGQRRFFVVKQGNTTIVDVANSAKTTHTNPYEANIPNAQELSTNYFSFFRKARELKMRHERHHANAQTALLQFNVMVRQRVRPNVKTYTHLIGIMGKARMELTAYKLFNRMLQQNITPLPETYQALLLATSPLRVQLLQEIQRKLFQSVSAQPRHILKRRRELPAEALVESERYLEELVTDDPNKMAELNLKRDLEKMKVAALRDSGLQDEDVDPESPMATVYVSTLRKAFYGNEWANAGKNKLTAEQRASLRPRVEKLSDLELEMFLSIHRQEKRSTAEEGLKARAHNVDTVLNNVNEGFIYEMLKQREEYVNAMREIMEKNAELSEYVQPLAAGEEGSETYEAVPLDAKGNLVAGGRRKVRTGRKKKKKAAAAAATAAAKAAEEAAQEAAEEGEKVAVVTDRNVGSVQQGIRLRGTYPDVDYVKMAMDGQLMLLSIRQLKAFEEGEAFEELGLHWGRGTKAEHVRRIEKYLFGNSSEDTVDALPPHMAQAGAQLEAHDLSDEEGNRTATTADDALTTATPYLFNSSTVQFLPGVGGKNVRFRVPHIKNPAALARKMNIDRTKPRLNMAERRFLKKLNSARIGEHKTAQGHLGLDVTAQQEAERHPHLHGTQHKNHSGLWAASHEGRALAFNAWNAEQAERQQHLSPLRRFAASLEKVKGIKATVPKQSLSRNKTFNTLHPGMS